MEIYKATVTGRDCLSITLSVHELAQARAIMDDFLALGWKRIAFRYPDGRLAAVVAAVPGEDPRILAVERMHELSTLPAGIPNSRPVSKYTRMGPAVGYGHFWWVYGNAFLHPCPFAFLRRIG